MNNQAISYYARKFFPHMISPYGELCVKLVIDADNRRRDREENHTNPPTSATTSPINSQSAK